MSEIVFATDLGKLEPRLVVNKKRLYWVNQKRFWLSNL